MTDRPIIFSAPMVRALLAGRKTQTRRLASSPLRRCEVGDRLYVREHWKTSLGNNGVAPRDLDPLSSVLTLADRNVATRYCLPPWGKHRQGMHMPRWASRLTLIVQKVTIEPLNAITEADALAEGVIQDPEKGFIVPGVEHPNKDFPYLTRATAREMYAALWDVLHGSGAWLGNPDVLALTFRVVRDNIDQVRA